MIKKRVGKYKNELGNLHGEWEVLERAANPSKTREVHWLCLCSCGKQKVVSGKALRTGQSKCCGQCSFPKIIQTKGASMHYLYDTWSNILRRCYDKNNPGFKGYGDQGIKVYEEWQESPFAFYKWIEQNLGTRPEGHSLDRLNVYGDYVPGNLRWADAKQQIDNRRLVALSKEEYALVMKLRAEKTSNFEE